MKLRCSSILKAALALVLAVILLAGTTVSGFSAIVKDIAPTGSADTYYIVGNFADNWNTPNANSPTLTDHGDGLYMYYRVGSCPENNNRAFKIFSGVGWESVVSAEMYQNLSLGGVNINNITPDWANNSDNGLTNNLNFGFNNATDNIYLLAFYPRTYLNTTDHIICVVYQDTDTNGANLPSFSAPVYGLYGGTLNGDTDAGWQRHITGTADGFSGNLTLTNTDLTQFKVEKYTIMTSERGLLDVGVQYLSVNETYTDSGTKSLSGADQNFKVQADGTGSYGFSFDASNSQLTVTFPDLARNVTVSSGSFGKVKVGDGEYSDSVDTTASLSAAATISAKAEDGYFFTGWTTSNNYVTLGNAKSPNTTVNASKTGTVTAHFAKQFAAEGFTIYLYDNNSASHLSSPHVQFSTDSIGTHTVGGSLADMYTETTIYHAQVPANGAYGSWNFVRFYNEEENYDSGWQPITSVLTNSITYDGEGFHDIGFSTLQYNDIGYGHIYFDNTNTNWTVDATHKIYFVIGNSTNCTAYLMSNLSNNEGTPGKADKLYHYTLTGWDHYTYFGFALFDTTETIPNGNPQSVIDNAEAYTSFFSYYQLAQATGNYYKSFIGFGIGEAVENMSVLDFLWIMDKDVNGNVGAVSTYGWDPTSDEYHDYFDDGDPAHENDYLNRGIKLSVSDNGSAVTIRGVSITGNNYLGSYWNSTVTANSNDTFYYARTSTVTLSGIVPASGNVVRIKVGDGDWVTPDLDTTTTEINNDYCYSFTVPGGDGYDYGPVDVKVVYSPLRTVYAALAVLVGDTVDKPSVLMNEEANFGKVSMSSPDKAATYTVPVSGNGAFSSDILQYNLDNNNATNYLTLTASDTENALDGTSFVGWYNSSDLLVSSERDYRPTTAGTYYAVYSHDVHYRFSYISRDNSTKYYDQLSATNATYNELSSNVVDFATRSDEITTIGNTVSGLVSVFNTTLNFNTRTGTAADGSPLTATISSQNDDTVSTKTNYNLRLYSRVNAGESGNTASPLVSVSGNYNDPIDLTAMQLKNGDEEFKPAGMSIVEHAAQDGATFYCWQKRNSDGSLGDVISTQANYGFSLTGNLDIVPIFGTASGRTTYLENTLGSGFTTTWKAFVDRSEVTKELVTSGSSDLYNDTIVRFSNITNTSQGIGSNYTEYGVVILAQTGEGKTTKSDAFVACNNSDTVLNYLKALKGLSPGKNNAKMNTETYGKAYAFYIPTDTLSNLNRAEICLILDNALFSGGQYIVASYAYNPVSSEYIISDSELHTM